MSFDWRQFQGVNAAYVQELYERYRLDPHAVDEETRDLFAGIQESEIPGFRDSRAPGIPESPNPRISEFKDPQVVVGAVNLAQSIRRYGHLAASIDPLGSRPLGDPSLEPETHGVTEADLEALPASLLSSAI